MPLLNFISFIELFLVCCFKLSSPTIFSSPPLQRRHSAAGIIAHAKARVKQAARLLCSVN